MKVPIELYQRLSEDDLDLLTPGNVAFKENDQVQLKAEGLNAMESGYITAAYMIKLHQYGMFGDAEVDINALKSVRTGKADNGNQRVHNWNVIAVELNRVGIKVDSKFKSAAISGNHEQIVTVLLKLFEMEIEGTMAKEEGAGGLVEQLSVERAPHGDEIGDSPSKLSIMKEVRPEKPIDILHLNPERSLDKTKSTLEFVVISLVQSMKLSLKQAAGLLTDHNYYLMHACVKGLKGDYAPILSWYHLLLNTSKHLIDLAVESLPTPEQDNDQASLNESQILEEDTQPLFVLLGALKCGFYSDYFGVSDLAFKLFSQISTELNTNGYQKVFAKWFLQQPDQDNGRLGGGLEATLTMLSKHSQIAESVALLLISTFKGRFELLIPEIQENHIKGDLPKLFTLINDLLPFLHKHYREEVVEKILSESFLIEDLLKHSNTNKLSDNALKSACISLLVEIWSLEPRLISENPKLCTDMTTVLESCLKVFKNTCKFASKQMKLATIGLMFKLLDQFAASRDSQAPVIYKLLTFTMIENIQDDDIREFMMRSFTNVFASHKTIPVSILIEPILRTLQLQEARFQPNCLDYAFFATLAKHPKLQPSPLGLQIMDQFARATLNDPVWCSAAKVPLLSLADRFKSDPTIQDFLVKFCTLAINSVIQLKKPVHQNPFDSSTLKPAMNSHSSGVSHLRNLKNLQHENTNKVADQEKEAARKIKLAMIVQVVQQILKVFRYDHPNNEDERILAGIRDEIKDVVYSSSRRYFQIHGEYSKALMALIEHWHQYNAKEAFDEYMKRKDEAERPSPNEDDIRTIIREDLSHIHEERERMIIMETHSHRMSEVPTITSGRDLNLKHMLLNNGFDNDEYFRIMPSEDTNQSELDYSDIRNFKNNSQTRRQIEPTPDSRQPIRDVSQEAQGNNQLVPFNPSTQITLASYASKPPYKSTKLNLMAQRQIDAIKNRREEKSLKQKEEEEKKKLNYDKNVQKAKEEVIRRRVQLGVSKSSIESQKKEANEGQLMIYEAADAIPEENVEDENGVRNNSAKRFSMPSQPNNKIKEEGLKLIDLENEEEERERDGVRLLMTKYSKVFKFLFNKYALSRAQHQKVENFEYFGDKSINLPEVCKLLRDHELLTSISISTASSQVSTTRDTSQLQKLTKDQVAAVIRLLNLKNFKRQDLSALSFNHFMDLIPQLAYLTCQRTLGHLSMPEMVQRFLQHNEKATKAKGQSTILYEDPDITTIGDQDILKELNRRIKENPDCIIPEGYYKVSEKEQVFKYEIPQYLQFKESQRVAIEVLDEIMNEGLGFHILEALVTNESRYKVKPRIKHGGLGKAGSDKEPNSALSFMKPIDKKPFNRDLSGIKLPSSGGLLNPVTPGSVGGQSVQTPLPLITKKEDLPKLSPALKLELMALQDRSPADLRGHHSQVASTLEELLCAVVEGGHTHLPDPSSSALDRPSKTTKAQQDIEARKKQERDVQNQREEIRKKRHERLKEEIERQKLEKAKQEEEKKAEREEKEKEEKRKIKIERTMLRQRNESKRKEIDEVKAKKVEEKEVKAKEEEEIKMKEKAGRSKEQKEFFRKQKEQLGQEFVKRRQEIEEAEKAKQEMEELKKQQKEKVKSKVVQHIVANKDQNRNEHAEWQELQNFYDDQEVAHVFMKYEKAFGKMFKHFAVMDKKDMEVHGKQRVNLNEFQKFGYQKGIIPKMISNDEMVQIFRDTLREKAQKLTEKEKDELGVGVNTLGLDDFKKALIRVCVLAQSNLDGDEKLENILPIINTQPDRGISAIRAPKNIKIRGRSQINSRASQRGKLQLTKQDSQQQLEANQSQENIAQPLEATPVATSNKPLSLVRKTKEQKVMEELAKVKEREHKLMNVKIDSDKRFNKAFDVSVINPRTVEALIQFLGVPPNDEKRNAKLGLDSFLAPSQNKQGPDDVLKADNNDENQIEGVDLEELDKDDGGALDTENIIGPDGDKEQWKMAE